LLSFAAMVIKRLHIQLAGFVLLLGLMFVLNNRLEQKERPQPAPTETLESWQNDTGIAPLTAQIPGRTEGSLPIKLITNLNTNFLVFTNHSFTFRMDTFIRVQKKLYQTFCHKIQRATILNVLATAKNKDIR
jgi:hypothetical protein